MLPAVARVDSGAEPFVAVAEVEVTGRLAADNGLFGRRVDLLESPATGFSSSRGLSDSSDSSFFTVAILVNS